MTNTVIENVKMQTCKPKILGNTIYKVYYIFYAGNPLSLSHSLYLTYKTSNKTT